MANKFFNLFHIYRVPLSYLLSSFFRANGHSYKTNSCKRGEIHWLGAARFRSSSRPAQGWCGFSSPVRVMIDEADLFFR